MGSGVAAAQHRYLDLDVVQKATGECPDDYRKSKRVVHAFAENETSGA